MYVYIETSTMRTRGSAAASGCICNDFTPPPKARERNDAYLAPNVWGFLDRDPPRSQSYCQDSCMCVWRHVCVCGGCVCRVCDCATCVTVLCVQLWRVSDCAVCMLCVFWCDTLRERVLCVFRYVRGECVWSCSAYVVCILLCFNVGVCCVSVRVHSCECIHVCVKLEYVPHAW